MFVCLRGAKVAKVIHIAMISIFNGGIHLMWGEILVKQYLQYVKSREVENAIQTHKKGI